MSGCNHDSNQGHTCDQLGLCQQRTPACTGCTAQVRSPLRLAPGVLDGYRIGLFGTPAQRRELVRTAKHAAAWLVVLGVASMAAGYMSGWLR